MKKHWWNSLRVKIIAWSFVPTAIILSAVAWFTFYSYQKVLGDLAVKQTWTIVQEKGVQVNLAIGNLINPILLPIILDIDIQKELPLEIRAQNILDQAKYLETFDGGIYFLDQQGKVFITKPERPDLLGQDWSDNPDLRFIKANPGRGAFTDLRFVGPSGQGIICFSQSINGPQGEFLGAGYYCFSIDPTAQTNLFIVLNSLNLGPDVLIMDGNQRVIYSPDLSQLGKDLSGEAYILKLLQSHNMSIRFPDGTEDRVIIYNPVDVTINDRNRWVITKEQSWAEIMQPTLPYQRLLYGLLALGVIVPALVTAYGVRHITQPIQKLIHASEQVTAGQFKQRIAVKTGDEIETLADQFNLMSAELEESYASLEKKVADRTHELATLNAIAAQASSSLNLNEVMADALERLMELTGMEHGIAYRIEGGAQEPHLRVMAFRGLPPSFADLGDGLPLRQSAAGVAGQRGEPVIWTITELPTESALKQRLAALGVEQVIAIPLLAKGQLVGSLNLSTAHRQPFPPERVAFLKTVGQQIGVAVENAHLYEQAEQGAIVAERHRLARELHDAVTQTLFSANLIADVIPRIWQRNPEEGLQSLEELRQLTRGALAEMRTLLLEMRPESLDRADIKTLLIQLVDAFIGRVRIPVDLKINGEYTLPLEVKIVFYRVAQEALNNIAKHSGAQQVEVHLDCQSGLLTLLITDDGLGFEPGALPPGHMGVAIMRERAVSIGASIKIESQVGQGTTVELTWSSPRRD